MKLLSLWIGFIGFLVMMGGVGRAEIDPNGFYPGALISVIGFVIMIASFFVEKYMSNGREVEGWEKRFQKKKKKRLGLT